MDQIIKLKRGRRLRNRSRFILYLGLVTVLALFIGFLCIEAIRETYIMSTKKSLMSYHSNIISSTATNNDFRHVLFTGANSQLVIMSIPPGGEVGKEIHKYTEQTLFFLSGKGTGELNGKQFPIVPGDVVIVTTGTEHNFWNTGTEPLKIYTVYAPPNHIDGRVQKTKANADADKADEAIGEKAPVR